MKVLNTLYMFSFILRRSCCRVFLGIVGVVCICVIFFFKNMCLQAYFNVLENIFKANTICLPFHAKPRETFTGYHVTIAGWGYTKYNKTGGYGM